MRYMAMLVFLMLFMVAYDVHAAEETPGLSKGSANPADIGQRCAPLMGRDDRAYLQCQQEEAAKPLLNPQKGGEIKSQHQQSGGGAPPPQTFPKPKD
jgi:hypothetical protein